MQKTHNLPIMGSSPIPSTSHHFVTFKVMGIKVTPSCDGLNTDVTIGLVATIDPK